MIVLHLTQVHTCPPAMGFSFAAGTTDGPGAFNFVQGQYTFDGTDFSVFIASMYAGFHHLLGDTSGNTFWNLVRDIIASPTQEQVECHHPKPILLNTGGLNFPYPWQPRILPLQLLRIGQLVIAGVPAEFR